MVERGAELISRKDSLEQLRLHLQDRSHELLCAEMRVESTQLTRRCVRRERNDGNLKHDSRFLFGTTTSQRLISLPGRYSLFLFISLLLAGAFFIFIVVALLLSLRRNTPGRGEALLIHCFDFPSGWW